jgi:quercetin dioxygenase-like cupin family protein
MTHIRIGKVGEAASEPFHGGLHEKASRLSSLDRVGRLAQDAVKVTIVTPEALAWKDAPLLPKGAQYVVLMGDPTKAGGMFVQRVKLPANYQIPPHTHPSVAIETVLTGNLGVGMGEEMDAQKGEMLKPGSFLTIPARHAHYAWTASDHRAGWHRLHQPGGRSAQGRWFKHATDDEITLALPAC